MTCSPAYFRRLNHLLLLLRKTLEPYRSAYSLPLQDRDEGGQPTSGGEQTLISDLSLVLHLSILRSERHQKPAARPSEEPTTACMERDLAIDFQAAIAQEILALRYPVPVNPVDLDLLWNVYRAALLHFVQNPPFRSSPFSDVSKREEDAAVGTLARLFVQTWNTTSPRMPADAREGLLQLGEELDMDRDEAKQMALAVGLLQALSDWEEPRRIRLGPWWIYENGEIAKFSWRGLNDLQPVQQFLVRTGDYPAHTKGNLKSIDGFSILIRHLRRQMFTEAEAWLAARSNNDGLADAGLASVPDGVKPELMSLEPELIDSDRVAQGASISPAGPDDELAPEVHDGFGALLEAADREFSQTHRDALASLSPHQKARLRRLLQLLTETGDEVDTSAIKREVADEEGVSVNAIDQLYSKLRRTVRDAR